MWHTIIALPRDVFRAVDSPFKRIVDCISVHVRLFFTVRRHLGREHQETYIVYM